MRLFAAILFDEELHCALEGYADELKRRGARGRFTLRENLHLTMAFIGEYGEPDRVLEAMRAAAFRPMDICLDGAGNFGDLLWAGVSGGPGAAAFAKRLRRELAARRIPCDKKRFMPHITLVRRATLPEGFVPPPVPPAVMRAGRVSLMKSERGPGGMIYTEIGSAGEPD